MTPTVQYETTAPDLFATPDDGAVFGGLAPDEIVIDCFAGGGGASTGIEWAIGRSPDEAINHSATAIAIHTANHPTTRHWHSDVWETDPAAVAAGRPVGLAWFSPDCTHFSRAKGGKPVSKKIRMLAHAIVWYAAKVRPRIIMGENVEEFQTWGPVSRATKRPDPTKKGKTFRAWVRQLERLGYRVEWRMLRGCDFGAPTTRRRLFFVARRDGLPIRWPLPTHGKGRAKPVRVAAECIDFSLPCPSIFLTAAEAKALGKATGRRVKRPLAAATLRRIARGIDRFVINAAEPFIVRPAHSERAGSTLSLHEPVPTVTGADEFALVEPFLVPMQHDNRPVSLDEPLQTVTTQGNKFTLVAPVLIPRFGEDPHRNGGAGQEPRCRSVERPFPTIVPSGNGAQLVAAFLAKHYGDTGQRPGSALSEPVDTITPNDHHALVTAHLQRDFGKSVGSDLGAPMPTVTGGGGGHAAVVATHLMMLNANSVGQSLDVPMHTVVAGATRFAEVRAFLVAYYGTQQQTGGLRDPLPAVTAHDRFALVTVHGVEYAIVDIGMRMLTARELANGQGFPPSHILAAPIEQVSKSGKRRWTVVSETAQKEMVGNSVNPDVARDLALANLGAPVARERAA